MPRIAFIISGGKSILNKANIIARAPKSAFPVASQVVKSSFDIKNLVYVERVNFIMQI